MKKTVVAGSGFLIWRVRRKLLCRNIGPALRAICSGGVL